MSANVSVGSLLNDPTSIRRRSARFKRGTGGRHWAAESAARRRQVIEQDDACLLSLASRVRRKPKAPEYNLAETFSWTHTSDILEPLARGSAGAHGRSTAHLHEKGTAHDT